MTASIVINVLILLEIVIDLTTILYILCRRNARHNTTLTWILVIIIIPFVGGPIIYFLFGEPWLSRRRTQKQAEILKQLHESPLQSVSLLRASHADLSPRLESLSHLAEAVSGYEPQAGNKMRLINDTEELVQSIVQDISQAQNHVHVLTYIFLNDESGNTVANALIKTAQRGITCRLLVDSLGSRQFLQSDLPQQLRDAGVHVAEALPTNIFRAVAGRFDLRNHRKITIIDGQIAYTGSHNLASASFAVKPKYAPWVDATARIMGPVARDLQKVFIEDWFLDTDESLLDMLEIHPTVHPSSNVIAQILGTGPNSLNDAISQLIITLMHLATDELVLTTPYFVPDQAVVAALCTAARRGVNTILVVPKRNDSRLVSAASRSYYSSLLESGIKIREYTKGLLHAKTISIDKQIALVTSANLDRRSFELNLEISMLVYDTDFASELRFLQQTYIDSSNLINARDWENRAWWRRLAENTAGTLSPLL